MLSTVAWRPLPHWLSAKRLPTNPTWPANPFALSSRRPPRTSPPPTPVEIVRYAKFPASRPAPNRDSASAAAAASLQQVAGPSCARIAPRRSKPPICERVPVLTACQWPDLSRRPVTASPRAAPGTKPTASRIPAMAATCDSGVASPSVCTCARATTAPLSIRAAASLVPPRSTAKPVRAARSIAMGLTPCPHAPHRGTSRSSPPAASARCPP